MTNKLIVYKSNNAEWQFDFKDQDGEIVNLTGASITFTVKESIEQTLVAEIIRQNTAAGGDDNEIEIDDAAAGLYSVKLVPVNTASLDEGGYYYDIKITLSGREETVASNKLLVKATPND